MAGVVDGAESFPDKMHEGGGGGGGVGKNSLVVRWGTAKTYVLTYCLS